MDIKTVGILLIVGSVVLWGGSFFPINMRLYSQTTPEAQLEVVKNEAKTWKMVNIVFMLGAIITAVGVWGYSQQIKADAGIFNLVGLAAFILGAVLFAWFTYQRGVTPESYIKADGSKPTLLLVDMWIMTLAVLAYGLVFRELGYPGWLTWGTLILGVVFVVYQIALKDMVPMFHYIITLALGIFLL